MQVSPVLSEEASMKQSKLTFAPLSEGPVDFPAEEKKVQKFWDEKRVFEEALRKSEVTGKPEFVWLDGPPFATGKPHYGHLLAGTLKDVVCRFRHQTGWHVPRRFGWDCHGLPVEQLASKQLNLSGRQAVLDFGVCNYCDYCEGLVQVTTDAWEEPLKKLGRWCNLENTWKTMDKTFMESVWWAFSELHRKGLVYKAFKVMPYSTGCQTVLSNSEVSADCYKDVVDKSLMVKFRLHDDGVVKVRELVGGDGLRDDEAVYMLAWTSTHWTLPANQALAVNPQEKYCVVRVTFVDGVVVNYVCGVARVPWVVEKLGKDGVEHYLVVGEDFLGKYLYKLKYHPLYKLPDRVLAKKFNVDFHSVLLADYVSNSSGTMVVHQCPAYGAEDFETCVAHEVVSASGDGLWDYLDADGNCAADLGELKFIGNGRNPCTQGSCLGLYVKGDEFFDDVVGYLSDQGSLAKVFDYEHSYPHCWRTGTPLVYRAVSSWFVKVDADLLLKNNAKAKWVPSWVQDKRFHNWVANARDWCVSRSRFWGTPLPLWASDDLDEVVCVSSAAELADLTGAENLPNLHRQYVDGLRVPSKKKPGTFLKRVDDVFDCWFESGCVPLGSNHYPFAQESARPPVPAHFVAEGLDQTRGWFNALHVLASLLFDQPAFENLVCNGLVLAEDGQKMSKSKQNYPEATAVMDRKGADALRLYLCSSPAAQAQELRFNEDGLTDVVKDVLLKWHNAYKLFLQETARYERVSGACFKETRLSMYEANLDEFELMDQWLLSLSASFTKFVRTELEEYRLYNVQSELVKFLYQLTKWYVPLKRNDLRGVGGLDVSLKSLSVFFQVLYDLTVVMSPMMPFYTETMFLNLRNAVEDAEVSVHHTMLPAFRTAQLLPKLEAEMVLFQQTVESARLLRERRQVGFKTPVKSMKVVFQERCKMLAMQKFQSLFAELLNVVDVDLSECLEDSFGENAASSEVKANLDSAQTKASVMFVPTLKKKKNCVKKKMKRAQVSAEAVESELKQVTQTQLHKFWLGTLSTPAESVALEDNSKDDVQSQPHLTVTLSVTDATDAETTADSDGFEVNTTAVRLFREDLDVTPELTSCETCDTALLETTIDSNNNLVTLDFTPSSEFSKMALCRNLVSQVQRMLKKLDALQPGAAPSAKVRVVVLSADQSLFHTLSEMRDYVVKYLRRDFLLSQEASNANATRSEAHLVENWQYPEETLAARVELF
jgi:isoleucyl-tRNA synthetase